MIRNKLTVNMYYLFIFFFCFSALAWQKFKNTITAHHDLKKKVQQLGSQ